MGGRLQDCRLECALGPGRAAPRREAGEVLPAAGPGCWPRKARRGRRARFLPERLCSLLLGGGRQQRRPRGLAAGQLQQVGCGARSSGGVKFPGVWRVPRPEGAPARRPPRPDAETRPSAGDPRPSFLAGIPQPCAAPRLQGRIRVESLHRGGNQEPPDWGRFRQVTGWGNGDEEVSRQGELGKEISS